MDRQLINYIPNVLMDVREIKSIMVAEQPEVSSLWIFLNNALNDQFIDNATENGVKRWEKILAIVPKGTDSLSSRKIRILARLNEELPYTFRKLCLQLESICGKDGYTAAVYGNEYKLSVRISLVVKSNFNDVQRLLNRIVPANMIIDLLLKYNQHQTFLKMTHAQMKAFTHTQLREDVLK